MKQNCWEAKNCGREPGGTKVGEMGICPTAIEKRLDGVHSGKNGGCLSCDFYGKILSEEYPNVQLSVDLLNKLVEDDDKQ